MARIVFLTIDGGGNVPPAIADELARDGHAVRFLGHERQRQRITAHGHRAAENLRTERPAVAGCSPPRPQAWR